MKRYCLALAAAFLIAGCATTAPASHKFGTVNVNGWGYNNIISAYAANAGVTLPESQAITTITSASITIPTTAPSDGATGGLLIALSCFGYTGGDVQNSFKFGIGVDESTSYTTSEQVAIIGISGVGSAGTLHYRAPMSSDGSHTVYALASNGSTSTAETADCTLQVMWSAL